MALPSQGGRKEGFIMNNNINNDEKFCTRCGKKFIPVGREVICPECREAAAEESKKAAVLKAKRASWMGESVPVRISGRASTLIRRYGAANGLPFAEALDDLLKASDYFKSTGGKWEDVEPYRSRRRDKSTAQDKQEAPHAPQDVQAAKAAKVASKTSTTAKKAVKTKTSTSKK